MGIAQKAVQWTKYVVGSVLMLIATVALAGYLSGGEDIAGVGLPLLLVFVLIAKAYGNFLGLGN